MNSEKPAIEKYQKHGVFKLLVTAPVHFLPAIKEEIIKESDCIFAYGTTKEEVIELVKNTEGWMCSPCPTYKIDKDILSFANKLRVIGTPSTGSNHIDGLYCQKREIIVTSLKDTDFVNTIYASSEYTFSLLLAVVRKIPYAFESAKQGCWREVEDQFRGIELNGKVLGIIGYGRIGSNVSRYANAMGMNVAAYDPYKTITDSYVTQSNVDDVLGNADIILVCVHLDETTRNMVNNEWFEKMKDGVYFVNTSRGEIIDEGALLHNLQSGKIRAAGLDVISQEFTSDKKSHPIIRYAREHDNLIVTPHIAGSSYESEYKAAKYTFESIKGILINN